MKICSVVISITPFLHKKDKLIRDLLMKLWNKLKSKDKESLKRKIKAIAILN